MRVSVVCLALVVTLSTAMMSTAMAADQGAAPAPLTAHPDTTGWESVFNADLSNTEKPEGVWSVTDGVITANTDKEMWTLKDYENFILDLEFKNEPGTNSGVFIYRSDAATWISNSMEIQIADDFAEVWASKPKTWQCGAIFGHMPPTKSMVKKPGEWNHYSIQAIGQNISVVLNGEPIINMDMKKWDNVKTNPDGSEIPAWYTKPYNSLVTKGKIGLQGKHGGVPIYFRNIKIKELK